MESNAICLMAVQAGFKIGARVTDGRWPQSVLALLAADRHVSLLGGL
jgi:hypothetical protein